jgi:hypothetical protein
VHYLIGYGAQTLVTRAAVRRRRHRPVCRNGITPVDVITSINDRFVNLLPQDVGMASA